jgi:hypothetical protein
MTDGTPDHPVYRRKARILQAFGIAVVVYYVGGALVLPVLGLVRHAVFPTLPPAVVIDNQSGAGIVVWGSTEPSPIPTSDGYVLDNFGFAIGPHVVAVLPQNHDWNTVDVFSPACEFLSDEVPDGPSRITIAADGGVAMVSGGLPENAVAATPTVACKIEPWVR